jgi:TetR/AcrR family transcriptional regulator, cholesterol catabolism regulator
VTGPRDQDTESTRERVLVTAAGLFQEKGYDGTSMSELAKRVGITAAGLYWHFSSKEEILIEYLESVLMDLLHATGAAASHDEPRDALRAFVVAHVRFQLDRLDAAKVYGAVSYGHEQLKGSLGDEGRARLQALERRHLANLERILTDGVRRADFDVADVPAVAFAILAMGEHAVFWFRANGRLSPDAVAEMYGELATRMVTRPA